MYSFFYKDDSQRKKWSNVLLSPLHIKYREKKITQCLVYYAVLRSQNMNRQGWGKYKKLEKNKNKLESHVRSVRLMFQAAGQRFYH